MSHERLDATDVAAISRQLGREPRGMVAVAHRCDCGQPDVVTTEPRLPDGTPFPTMYYLTCPRAASRIGTLEADGLMKELEGRLADEPDRTCCGMSVPRKLCGVMRVAAIDCGTNSIRLLIADIDNGTLTDVVRTMVIVRLGQDVDQTGQFAPDALERTFAAADQFAALIAEHQPERIRFVATSASRDVSNRNVFVEGIRSRLGIEPDVISGDEEARLSFLGATADILGSAHAPQAPYLVVDIGGGSTEFVLGTTAPEQARSTNVGCVRMTERHLRTDPPTPDEISGATADIDAAIALAAETVDLGAAHSIIGLAGSVTTVAALALGLDQYDPHRIHGARISAANVHEVTQELLHMTRAQRAVLGPIHEGRIDVIGAGALVLDRIMQATGLPEVVVSERDILDGIARDVANR